MHKRYIQFDGKDVALHGRKGDSYFDHAVPDEPFKFAMTALPDEAVVFDIGSNIGMTAVIAAKRGAAKVYAFEPDPNVFPFLLDTIKANAALVDAHNIALGSKKGTLSFFSNPDSASASHLVTENTLGHSPTHKVEMSTFDAFVTSRQIDRIDFIKIDVEGFEIDVLWGARETIPRLKPSLLIEFNAFTMVGFRDINPRDLLRLLLEIFPNVYRFKNGRAQLIDSDDAALGFIHDNLVSAGCVDDLYCTFRPVLSLLVGQ
ncbi:FkbM family methyltransferase [Mesorhizobium opportunistum]|uniref:FkbM family methyltransferase n=1 Tax=Mesorhizobium opportunistum TaxID=593909 RepID=UPI003339357E